MFAPAKIPVAAGKKMAKTVKKFSPSRKSGMKFADIIDAVGKRVQNLSLEQKTVLFSNIHFSVPKWCPKLFEYVTFYFSRMPVC